MVLALAMVGGIVFLKALGAVLANRTAPGTAPAAGEIVSAWATAVGERVQATAV